MVHSIKAAITAHVTGAGSSLSVNTHFCQANHGNIFKCNTSSMIFLHRSSFTTIGLTKMSVNTEFTVSTGNVSCKHDNLVTQTATIMAGIVCMYSYSNLSKPKIPFSILFL